jgi:hypothetical protein
MQSRCGFDKHHRIFFGAIAQLGNVRSIISADAENITNLYCFGLLGQQGNVRHGSVLFKAIVLQLCIKTKSRP